MILEICDQNYWNQFLRIKIYHKLQKNLDLVRKFGENLLDRKGLKLIFYKITKGQLDRVFLMYMNKGTRDITPPGGEL